MTASRLKRKDAAKAGTSPRHVQPEPTKEQEMNARTSITPPATPANFPLPYAAETAFTQADQAMSLLRSACALLGVGATMDPEEKHDVLVLLENAKHTLEPVLLFLDEVEYEGDNLARFVECRRAWIRAWPGAEA